MDKKGVSRFSVGVFLSQIAEKTSLANSSLFQKCSGFKNPLIIGVSQFCQIFCLTSPRIIAGKPVCVSEVFLFQIILDNKGMTILSIVSVSQCRRFCGEPSNDSKNLGHPKNLSIIGEFHDFPGKHLVLQYRKTSWGNAFVFQKNFSTEKVYG